MPKVKLTMTESKCRGGYCKKGDVSTSDGLKMFQR